MRPYRADHRRKPASLITSAPVDAIDQRQLDELRGILAAAKLRDLLGLAQAELVQRPGEIRRLAEERDFAILRNVTHSLKGAVSSLGLAGVAHAAQAVELATPGTELEGAIVRLEAEAVRARAGLAPVLSDLRVLADLTG